YLRQITTSLSAQMRSVEVGREMVGSSPPSVFVGSHAYPKVYAGPIISVYHGDTRIMDAPESWIPSGITQEEIIRYRLSLVRGKQRVDADDIDNPFVEKLQEIALSSSSVESEVTFETPPAGMMFSNESLPHGPSARMEQFEIEKGRWDRDLEKVYYDTDLAASGAVVGLHRQGVPFSSIQKAFSVGTMGAGRKRKLVPTRWSITACDTLLGDHLLSRVRQNSPIDCYRIHEFDSLNNHYEYVKILRRDLESTGKKLQSEVLAEQAALEKEGAEFQHQVSANIISEEKAKIVYEQLMQKSSLLDQKKQRYTQQVADHEMNMNLQLIDSLTTFLKRFNRQYKFDYIMGYKSGGEILIANDTLDITKSVLDALNTEYQQRKK
ncbi:MAG: OmpH family outer membrane protein, partial [Bacteroidota bacterium]